MKRLYMTTKKLLLLPFTLVLIACGGGKNGNGNINENENGEVTLEQLMLPDTCYASVEDVKFVVEDADSLPHPLKDFDDRYAGSTNVMAFRKNLLRNADFGGKVTGTPSSIEIAWTFTTDYDTTRTKFGVWGGGSGWTGQPLYMKWTDEQMTAFRQQSPGLTPDFGRARHRDSRWTWATW